MLTVCSLQSLFQQYAEISSESFEKQVADFFKSTAPPHSAILEECQWQEPLFSNEKIITNWKRLLAFNILCHLSQSHQEELPAQVRAFESHPWNRSSQFLRALIALNHAFAKMPIPEVGPNLLESGAALIELHEYCPWLSLSYHPQHIEFGLFLSLLALLTKNQELRESLLRLVHWQMTTLDVDGKPLAGLFVREKDSNYLHLLCTHYLLFKSAAALSSGTPFGTLADALLKEIYIYVEGKNCPIDPLWPLIERWLDAFKASTSTPLQLPEQVYDPSTALVGYRSAQQSIFCTLHGGHTGLGAFRWGKIEIVNYGPQYLPLSECHGFGIEGNALSDTGARRSVIEWRPHAFSLKGCARLVDQTSTSSFEIGQFRGIWMDIVQEFKRPDFYLKTHFLGLEGWDAVAFSFFVKAQSCRTEAQERLLPRTLKRYEGAIQTLTFEYQDDVLELRALSSQGRMEVIPLAGGDHFWGADFLVAYHLTSDQSHYQWHIGPTGL